MSMPLRISLLLAWLSLLINPLYAQDPVPLFEEGGSCPDNFRLTFSQQENYVRPQYLRNRDSSSGKKFAWSSGIEIFCEQDAVRLYINGLRKGVLPWQGNGLRTGIYRFRLEKEGFVSEEFMVILEPDKRITIEVILLENGNSQSIPSADKIDSDNHPNIENSSDIKSRDATVIIPCNFRGFPGGLFCPFFPKSEMSDLNLSARIGLSLYSDKNHWQIPLTLNVGSGYVPNMFFSFSGGAYIGLPRDTNGLSLSLTAGLRLSNSGEALQYGFLARLDYDPFFEDFGMINLYDTDSTLTGLSLSFLFSGNTDAFIFFGVPEISLCFSESGQEQAKLFEEVSFMATLRGGLGFIMDSLSVLFTGAVSLREWNEIRNESFVIFSGLDLKMNLPYNLIAVELNLAGRFNGNTYCLSPEIGILISY